MRKPAFCGLITANNTLQLPDPSQFDTLQELLVATAHTLQGTAIDDYTPSADDFRHAELTVIRQAQRNSFPNDVAQLEMGKPLCSDKSAVNSGT